MHPVFRVGDAEITRVEELFFTQDPHHFFPGFDESMLGKELDWLHPEHIERESGLLRLSVHSWVVRCRGLCILIDCCCGNHKTRPDRPTFNLLDTPWLSRLKAAGVEPEDVDMVLCTHLHHDHVGWNTRLSDGRWVPTFPNARYVFSRTDYEHYDRIERDPSQPPAGRGSFADSVLPIVEAGRAELVDGPHSLNDLFLIEPAGGHTPGHVVFNLLAGSARAMFTGDVLHHALQVYRPELSSAGAFDPAMDRDTRRRVLEQCCERGALLLPAHFGAPHAGYIRPDADGFRLELVEH